MEIGSQHLADNESIHGSMRNSVENFVSMVIQDNLPVENVHETELKANTEQVKQSKKVYDKFMKSKRNQKSLDLDQEGNEDFIVPCNLKLDLQKVESPEVCLDLNSVEMSGLSLLERARLFTLL